MIFAWVVRRLRWLSRVPLLPAFFDAALLIGTSLFHRPCLRAMEKIEASMARIPRVKIQPHRFGGIGFSLDGKELGHIHGNGLLDVFVGKTRRDEFVRNGNAIAHHIFPNSGWVSFWIRDEANVNSAIELLGDAKEYRQAKPVTSRLEAEF
jgi:hypothetical protein